MISAIIPVYNRPALLKEAYNSCIGQNYSDLEIIIADDGSADETFRVAKELAAGANDAGYPKTVLIRSDHTGKPGLLRNISVDTSRGDYIAFLDSDDLWLPGKLQRQTAFFREHPEIRICHTRERWLRGEKEISQKSQTHIREGNLFPDSLKKCIIGPSTVMMHRSLYKESGGFREDIAVAEDYEFWLRITCREPVGYIPEALTVKRAGGWEQLSASGPIEYFRIEALKKLITQNILPADCQAGAEKELVRKCLIYARGCRKRGKKEEASQYEELAAVFRI